MAKGYFDLQVNVQVNSVLDEELAEFIKEDIDPSELDPLVDSFVQELVANREYLKSRIKEALTVGQFVYTFAPYGPGKEKHWLFKPLENPRWQEYRGCTCQHCLKLEPV